MVNFIISLTKLIVKIEITDPSVKLCGFSIESNLEEVDEYFKILGYEVKIDKFSSHYVELDGFVIYYSNEKISILAKTSNVYLQ